ncbi:hypothetical protein [Rhodococcus erythropolis]|uniref:Uncharacterized protein n=1 Tax=Rhodococcus erythropolis TaxID=1833 RepID=A0AAX4A021_RHOER|nr:hypothetical protein [Rhodococcus erythropolis]WMN01889.1 hypothetical protein QIE55_31815 [Rhodococcus erythropolis]WMN03175.1 hypothetical protein QIE55_32760 [Rhodococcus erythropolis]
MTIASAQPETTTATTTATTTKPVIEAGTTTSTTTSAEIQLPATTDAATSTIATSSPETPATSTPTSVPTSTETSGDTGEVAFVKEAINIRQAVGVTTTADRQVGALDQSAISDKQGRDTARLKEFLSGSAYDQAKLGLDSGIEAEKAGDTRITDGGSRVLSVDSVVPEGSESVVTGVSEEWLTTDMLLPDGWKSFPAYSQSNFTAKISKNTDGKWTMSSFVSTRTEKYPH